MYQKKQRPAIHAPGACGWLYAIGCLAAASTACAGGSSTTASQPSQTTLTARHPVAVTRRVAGDSNKTSRKGDNGSPVLMGAAAMTDWTADAPGVRRHITVADLPAPYATSSSDNGPHMVRRPEGAWPQVPTGFKVDEFATGLDNPRVIQTAPNGDLFVVESGPGRVLVMRAPDGANKPAVTETYAEGLTKPFGLAFYPPGPRPQWVYIGNTDSVVRFPYQNGDLHATGPSQVIVPDIPGGGRLRGGGHWTRDIVFSRDGKKMFVSVGSLTNVGERGPAADEKRADILQYNPDGSGFRIFASGIRNAVGIAIHPDTGDLWASVNERDGLGDNLVPDYITRVRDGGFYGWPWFYMGGNQDPRHNGEHPELRDRVIVPDVLLESHLASLKMTFYTGHQFPKEYFHDAFAAEHGSWNRFRRVGYKLIRVPLHNGQPSGVYEDFMTGFVTPEGNVWGRLVGVTVAHDGSLLVTDDGSGTIWRISYVGTGTKQ